MLVFFPKLNAQPNPILPGDYKAYLRRHYMLGRTLRPLAIHSAINTTLAMVRVVHGVHQQAQYVPLNPNQKDKRVQRNWCKRKTSHVCT